ncbi:MAG: lysophospholipid acyltransferase family protein [Alphaproteobacteria bacterium]|nr:lysophospholipid acyltransferase family protein [Alphaproteobacteria bacterium]
MILWLRSLCFNIYLYGVTSLLAVLGSPAMLVSEAASLRVMHVWSQLVNLGLRRICNIHIEIRGQENLPANSPALIACKHQSMWDTIIFLSLLPRPVYVLKKELGLIPFFGWYTIATGMVRVDRDGHASALKKMIADSKRCIAEGKTLVIFPEGSRAPAGGKLEYKPGIAAMYHQLGVGCVPAALNSGLFWPRRKFLRPPGTIVLEFLPPIAPGLNRRDFMATVEERIETATGKLLAEG